MLNWETIEREVWEGGGLRLARLAVPGGWLVKYTSGNRYIINDPRTKSHASGIGSASGLTFVPDPNHTWVIPRAEEATRFTDDDEAMESVEVFQAKLQGLKDEISEEDKDAPPQSVWTAPLR